MGYMFSFAVAGALLIGWYVFGSGPFTASYTGLALVLAAAIMGAMELADWLITRRR